MIYRHREALSPEEHEGHQPVPLNCRQLREQLCAYRDSTIPTPPRPPVIKEEEEEPLHQGEVHHPVAQPQPLVVETRPPSMGTAPPQIPLETAPKTAETGQGGARTRGYSNNPAGLTGSRRLSELVGETADPYTYAPPLPGPGPNLARQVPRQFQHHSSSPVPPPGPQPIPPYHTVRSLPRGLYAERASHTGTVADQRTQG